MDRYPNHGEYDVERLFVPEEERQIESLFTPTYVLAENEHGDQVYILVDPSNPDVLRSRQPEQAGFMHSEPYRGDTAKNPTQTGPLALPGGQDARRLPVIDTPRLEGGHIPARFISQPHTSVATTQKLPRQTSKETAIIDQTERPDNQQLLMQPDSHGTFRKIMRGPIGWLTISSMLFTGAYFGGGYAGKYAADKLACAISENDPMGLSSMFMNAEKACAYINGTADQKETQNG
jgi:hypothetical protein